MTTTAFGTAPARGESSSDELFPDIAPLRGLQRSDSLDLIEDAKNRRTNNYLPSSCVSCAMTADTEEWSESFSSLLSQPAAAPAPTHNNTNKMSSAAFFESAFFSQMQNSTTSLPDDLMMGGGGGSATEARRRGGRRRKTNAAKGSSAGQSLLERAMALEVPTFPTELLLVDVDIVKGGSGSSRRVNPVNTSASSAHQTREDDDVDVIPSSYDATIRNQEDYLHSQETSPDVSDSILLAPPCSNPVVVCQCCYDEIDPQSTMQTFTCSESTTLADDSNSEGEDDDDDDELNALPPKPPLPFEGNKNNHAVCAHCLASYVHEWVFGGTSYPLRKQRRPNETSGVPDPSAAAAKPDWAWELPCLSSECPNGSYPRHVVQSVITSQAMTKYDEKLHRIYDGPKAKAQVAASAHAAPELGSDDPARPPSPARSRSQLEVEETLTERRIRRCAVCCASFVKESNTCNKIRCPHCNFRFCFVCLTDLPAKGYTHFCTHQYDAACDLCVKEGITCHLWSHEHDASESIEDDNADPLENADIGAANQQQDQPRKDIGRHSSAKGKEKAERFLKKLLHPARKGHNKA